MAQDLTINKQIMNNIMMDHENYLYATAVADSFDLAVKEATGMLASQIMTDVKSESKSSLSSMTNNGDFSESSYFSNITETFTNVQLSDYQVLMIDKPTKKSKTYTAFVYISSKRVAEIIKDMKQAEEKAAAERFNKLKTDINFYYDEGNRALSDIRIGDALKYYFWGYALSSGTKISIERNGNIQPAEPLFSSLIDRTLDAINIVCTEEKEEQVNEYQTTYTKQLAFYYNQDNSYKKITCLDFSYHNGYTYIGGPRVRDGISMAELSYDLDQLKVHCTYKYGENETPPEIQEILKNKQIKTFASSDKLVDVKKVLANNDLLANDEEQENADESNETDETVEQASASDEAETVQTSSTYAIDSLRILYLYDIMKKVESSIKAKKYESVEQYFTEDGYECFDKLIRYGNASIIGTPQYEFIPFGDLMICKSITMQFRFRNNKKFIENINFRFNKDDLIESLAFALTDVAQHDILDNSDWKMNSKLTLLTFMEDYQTAYALKRIDYLEKIFSENALIISGYKVLNKSKSDGVRLNGYTRYDTLSKTQYMSRLRGFFKNKEYINLNFTDTEFTQAWNTQDFFGVRVRQEYFSNTYGDVGYLFLLVDLRGKVPVIHVRAWQDDKLPFEHLFSLKDVY